jgi:hypothetical protein
MLLIDFDALTFDCYGALIDWESGMTTGLKPLPTELVAIFLATIFSKLARGASRANNDIRQRSAIKTCCRSCTSDSPRSVERVVWLVRLEPIVSRTLQIQVD